MTRKFSALVVAAILALVAGVAVVLYVSRADQRAVAGKEAKQVWVTTGTITRGMTVDAAKSKGLIVQETMPLQSVPKNAMTDLPAGSLVANSDVNAGEVLMTGRFIKESEQGPKQINVPAGHMAASVTLSDYQRVGSFVNPGDWVAVFYAGKDSDGNIRSYVLIPRAQVLGVGTTSENGTAGAESKSGPTSGNDKVTNAVMTLSVTAELASRLAAAAASDGSLQFTLLPAGESAPAGATTMLRK